MLEHFWKKYWIRHYYSKSVLQHTFCTWHQDKMTMAVINTHLNMGWAVKYPKTLCTCSPLNCEALRILHQSVQATGIFLKIKCIYIICMLDTPTCTINQQQLTSFINNFEKTSIGQGFWVCALMVISVGGC